MRHFALLLDDSLPYRIFGLEVSYKLSPLDYLLLHQFRPLRRGCPVKHDRVLEPLRPVDVLPSTEATPLRSKVGLPFLTNLDYLSAKVDGRWVRHGRPDAEPVDDIL